MTLAVRVVAGFFVALLCTPAGVSGAFLLLPIQVHVFHVPSPAVSATNLTYNVISTPAGALTYRRTGRLDRALALTLVAGSAPGVIVGALLRSTWFASEAVFGWIAAAVLLAVGARLFVDAVGWGKRVRRSSPAVASVPPWRLVGVGAVGGIIGGIYGIGGAALVVPWLVSVERMPIERVAGAGLVTTFTTSVIGMVTFAVAAGVGFGEAAAPEWAAGIALGVGGMMGGVLGARIQPRVPVRLLKVILGLAAIVGAVRTLA